MNIEIKKLETNKNAPIDLLLLADPSEKLVKEYLKRGICYVAKLDASIVGILLIIKQSKEKIEIMNIAVKEEYQRRGIGRALLDYTIKDLKGEAKILEIGTGNPSVYQLLLYQRCGFRITDIDFDFFRRNYDEPIFENGIECRDMLRLTMDLK